MEPIVQPGYYALIDFNALEGGVFHATLQLDPGHPIFKGHFPGMPVLPGVCMIRMVRETVEQVVGGKLRLVSGRNAKFVNVLDPNSHPMLNLVLQIETNADRSIVVDAILQGISGAPVFFKITATYLPDPQ